jgi:FAD/FMN-containing dehydrogenase
MPQWCNWSGSLRFAPRRLLRPRSEDELAALLARAARTGGRVRPVGSGHSSWPLVRSDDVLVSLQHLRGVVAIDHGAREATLRAGTRLDDAGRALKRHGLAFENLGDVDTQALAGALLTGTHGSGLRLANLASNLVGARLFAADGTPRELNARDDAELMRALRVSLGVLGVLSQVRLRLVENAPLRRRDYHSSTTDCMTWLDELAARHRSFDFYWYPRRDDVKIRTLNPAEQELVALPFARLVHEEVGSPADVIARKRTLKFEEMEYFVARENGPACFLALRRRMIERHRREVAWRVLLLEPGLDAAVGGT